MQHVAQFRGSFKVELLRRQLHSFPDSTHNFVRSSRKEKNDLVYHRAIVLLRLGQDARRLATLDVVIEAGTLWHLRRHVVIAATHREDLFHHVQCASHRSHIGVWPEIAGAVVFQTSCHEHAWKRLLHRDLDVGI